MAMRILAIETSSPQLSLAVGTEQAVLKEYRGPLQWRHAEILFQSMEKLLAQVRWPVQSLTGVVASIGPGSFTGIRIGLAAARALGQALHIPVVGVSSLETMAYRLSRPGCLLCPTIDALRGEVFTALYAPSNHATLKTVWKPQRMEMELLKKKLSSLRKQGSRTISNRLDSRLRGNDVLLVFPRAYDLLELGRSRLARVGPLSYRKVVPLYLRGAAAQERLKG